MGHASDMPEMVDTTCKVCARTFSASKHRVEIGFKKTCSRECRYAAVSAANVGPKTTHPCGVCGTLVERTASKLKRSKHGVFCSRACHYKGRSTGATKRVVTRPYVLTEAGNEGRRRGAAKLRGVRVLRPLLCANCGTTFQDPKWGRLRKSGLHFCSLACCNAFRKGANNPAWQGGHPKYYGPDWRPAQRAARARDGRTCRRCKVVSHRKALDVHHIKPVRTFTTPNDAHDLANLVCLCPSCHHTVEHRGIDFAL